MMQRAMIKEGVTQSQPGRERLAQPRASVRPPTARRIFLSAAAGDESEQESLEREFFSSLRLRNGTYKFTYARRLDDVNELLLPLLPAARPLEVMDVAVSSGISTLEWVQRLEGAGVAHRMVAGDLTVNAFLVSRGRHLHALVDDTGYPLQYEIFARALPAPTGRRLRVRYFAPLWLIERTLAARFARLRAECLQSPAGQVAAAGGVTCRRITLVSPRLRPTDNLEVVEDDVLGGWRGRRFHVLRAANILNRAYFAPELLTRALANLRARLLPGGLLVVCRTNEAGANHATVFRLQADRTLAVVARLGDGSEIEDLALEPAAESPAVTAEAVR
jgi:hypothetical protein